MSDLDRRVRVLHIDAALLMNILSAKVAVRVVGNLLPDDVRVLQIVPSQDFPGEIKVIVSSASFEPVERNGRIPGLDEPIFEKVF